MHCQRIAPVVVSIGIIILIAILRGFSKPLAAITATMPVTITLAFYIVYAAEGGDRAVMAQFSSSMLIGLVGTTVFLLVVWLASRAGWRIVPTLLTGYAAWGAWVALTFGIGHFLGR